MNALDLHCTAPFQALVFVPVSDIAEIFNEFVSSLDDETDEFLLSFLATLKQHGLVLNSVEGDEDQHLKSVCGTQYKEPHKAFHRQHNPLEG